MQFAIVALLAGILISQWTLHAMAQRESARTRRVMENIQQLLEKDQQSNSEILGALDDLQELMEDVHGPPGAGGEVS